MSDKKPRGPLLTHMVPHIYGTAHTWHPIYMAPHMHGTPHAWHPIRMASHTPGTPHTWHPTHDTPHTWHPTHVAPHTHGIPHTWYPIHIAPHIHGIPHTWHPTHMAPYTHGTPHTWHPTHGTHSRAASSLSLQPVSLAKANSLSLLHSHYFTLIISNNHKMIEVGRDSWGSPRSIPSLRQGHQEQAAQDNVQTAFGQP